MTSPTASPPSAAFEAGSISVTMRPSISRGSSKRRRWKSSTTSSETPAKRGDEDSGSSLPTAASPPSCSPISTVTCRLSPSRMISIPIFSPGSVAATMFRNDMPSRTGFPSKETTISSRSIPARSAGLSSTTSVITTPSVTSVSKSSAICGSTSWGSTPSQPLMTRPSLRIFSITLFAMLIGIAKPIPWLPPDLDRIAVLIPTSSPLVLISAPPELPGLIAASV